MIKGAKHSEETKRKMRGRIPWIKGKKHSEHIRKKISKKLKGRVFSTQHKEKISRARMGFKHSEKTIKKMSLAKSGKNNPFYGKHHTEKHKKKMSDLLSGRKHSKEAKQKMKKTRLLQIIPKKDTSIEVLMQNELKNRGYKFKTHAIVLKNNSNIRPYQCDILLPKQKIIIECDGNFWHDYPHHRKTDIKHTQELTKEGNIVLRYWGNEIKGNVEGCVNEIEDVILGV